MPELELKNWIVGESADHANWYVMHAAEPPCLIRLANESEEGVDTSDIEIRIAEFRWLGEPGDMDEMIELALDMLADYDHDGVPEDESEGFE